MRVAGLHFVNVRAGSGGRGLTGFGRRLSRVDSNIGSIAAIAGLLPMRSTKVLALALFRIKMMDLMKDTLKLE